MTTPSPSAESLTDTTNSSFATPPFSLSPVGESQGLYSWSRIQKFDDVSLPLPSIRLVQLPPPRELIITRRKTPTHDFGFSLRKAIVLDRSESLFIPISRPVIFAEPGTSSGNGTGLLPGDRLIKVNRQPVEELAREAIIEMIRNSGDSVVVEVQPVAELVELSRRCMPKDDPNHDDMDRSAQVSDCNTLRRSASKRFKSHVSEIPPFIALNSRKKCFIRDYLRLRIASRKKAIKMTIAHMEFRYLLPSNRASEKSIY